MKPDLSVALATFNEEANIARCLESVKDIADEIIVVDGTSTDRTVEIAKTFGAKVIVTNNPRIFHINKQKALDACTGEWILQMDADEVVSKALATEMETVIRSDQKENGYWIPRKNWFLGRFLMKGGQYPDYQLRFYRRGKAYLPQKDVHEQAVIEGEVGYLNHALLHYPYKNFSNYLFKWNRYNTIIAGQIREEMKNKNSISLFFYGIAYLFIKPVYWFILTFGRHKGFVDGWQGFTFSLFSALRFPVSYIKYLATP